jgi:eukaryotic-like serine/threonine-protein kinase
MAEEALTRAADLAVSRYGADADRVHALVEAALAASARGEPVDVYVLLEREQLLTARQVRDLRFALDQTQFDAPAPKFNGAPLAEDKLSELRMLGDYHLLRRLGEGGMGSVFLGYQERENRQVALKILASENAKHQPTLDRFHREGKTVALLNHPNIVRYLAFGQDKATGLYYLVFEYIDGQSAQQLLERFNRLTVGDAVHIGLDVARALEHAHSRNVVHRDIKPGNILVTKSGLAKLADLGLAKRTDETSHLTHARQGFGTPYYMPYEQAMNAKRADARSDIYALGATLYHLLAGDLPFTGANSLEVMDKKQAGAFLPARVHNPTVPEELDRILAKMLARDPQDRYQTASELIVDLERSGLAADVPSFIDPLDAYSDPLVRERLTAPAQATQLDVRSGAPGDFWFLLFRDVHGNLCKAKINESHLRRRLRTGRMSPHAKAARTPKGPFLPLHTLASFADVIGKSKRPKPATVSDADPLLRWWWMLMLTLIVSLVTLMILVLFIARQ